MSKGMDHGMPRLLWSSLAVSLETTGAEQQEGQAFVVCEGAEVCWGPLKLGHMYPGEELAQS